MVYCSRCGREVDPLWTHCPYCGAPLTPAAQQPVPEKRKDRRKLVAALVGLSGLLGLGYVAYRYYGDEIIAIIERLSGQAGQPTEAKTTTITKTIESTTSQSSSEAATTSSEALTTTSPQYTTTLTTTPTTSPTTSTTETLTTTTSPTTATYVIPELPERAWEELTYPYITVGGQAYLDEAQTNVINEGDAPSFYTVLELYQGPVPSRVPGLKFIEHPLNSFKLTWRKVVTLNPGQRLDFDFSGSILSYDVLVWVCYDPILDPRGFRMDSDAPLSIIFRRGPDRDRHVFAMGLMGTVEE
jgi:hypothetical protein